jgi:hypothetical protein
MQLWHTRPSIQPMPPASTDGYPLKTSDCIALVVLVLAIIAMPMVFDLAVALGIAH